MNHGELCAWHWATREPVRLQWRDGRIAALDDTDETPPRNLWLAPPLVDLQINGYGGVDFQQDDLTLDGLLAAVCRLRADGCTRFLFTLISDRWPRLVARLQHARRLRAQSAELREAIAGWHIEGPFLSAEPGFCGAHDPTVMCDPRPEHIHELREVTAGDLVLLTLAPERLDAIAAVSLATSLGIKVSLGHTNAPKKRLIQAIKAGALAFTHLGNGCPRTLDRHDNILWRVLETPGVIVSLIPDGIHVSPPLFRLMHRVLGPDAIYYTSDAMAAAGAPPGRYRLGRLELEVGEDRIVRLPGSPNFAGSALPPMDGAIQAAHMLRCPWQETWTRFSEAPARLMGLPHGLAVGQPATFCLLEITQDDRLQSVQVFLKGERVAA
jgi:N-acetylglucosamine-6-phosphate deacetylase